MFFKVFEDTYFLLFEALHGPLGLILPPSRADLVPKWAPKLPKSGPKSYPKVVQQMTSKITQKIQNLGPKMGPEMAKDGDRHNHLGGVLEAFGPKMRPRYLKMASSSPR